MIRGRRRSVTCPRQSKCKIRQASRQGPGSKSVPACCSFPVVQKRNGVVPPAPRKERSQALSQLRRNVGGWGAGPRGQPGRRTVVGTLGKASLGRQAAKLAPESAHSCRFTRTDSRPEAGDASRRWVPPAGQWFVPDTPPRAAVPRPAPLPVITGARHPVSARPPLPAAAAAMLSRSRCVSRAFSRSLSAFQKVRFGRAGPGPRRARNPPVGRPAAGRRGAVRRPGRAPRAPGRRGRGLGGLGLLLPSAPCCGAQRPLAFPRLPAHRPCCTPPCVPGLRRRLEPCPPRREPQSLGGGAGTPPAVSWGPSLLFC